MRKAAFFVLILFTYYLAGMYRSLPLMVLSVGELLLFVFLFFLSRYFRSRVSVAFPETGRYAIEGAEVPCRVLVQNRSRLPVGRIELRLRVRYLQDAKSEKIKLYGSAAPGESSLEFYLTGRYCGMAQVRIDRLRVFDYLVLFGGRKAVGEEMRVVIFPKEQALSVSLPDSGFGQDDAPEEQTIGLQGDAYDEIRQIREYQSGDPGRHIHWNQSARTGNLWIKEYERRTDIRMDVLIDSAGLARVQTAELSLFYKVFSALVLGLLQEGAAVRVHWHRGDSGGLVSADITDKSQCQDMLLQLYQTDLLNAGEDPVAGMEQSVGFYRYALRLSLNLALYRGDVLICQFSGERLEGELGEKRVYI